ncbi:MAG: hypothetical protein FGM39_06515 [Phycisphaerales bacterium]|nr:hypothetical protein [Phycisphaerales bacterium]
MNARTAIPTLLACALLGVLGGCGIFGVASKVGEAIEVEKKVEVLAKYRGLENKTVAVLVNAERGVLYEYPTVVPNVAGNVAAGIRKHVSGAQVLDWRESLAWAYRTPSWTTLPLGQVAEELGVDRVVLVDIFEFRLHPPGNRWIWDGMAGASIGIIERDSLDPDAFVEEYSVAVKFPDVADLSRESAQEDAIQTGLVAKFTQTVNKLFYDHLVDKYPNKRLKG